METKNTATCEVDASCSPGDHTRTWPCDYAPGTGRLHPTVGNAPLFTRAEVRLYVIVLAAVVVGLLVAL